jgi:hypothetical protein
MYYAGNMAQSTIESQRIGMATSTDGITWTKYDDPATADAPFAESDPVLMPGAADEWDDVFVHQPRVVITPEGWVMSYRSAQPGGIDKGYGFATSQDGIVWERYANNPYLLDDAVRGRAMWFNSLVYHDDKYYVFVEIQRTARAETDIYTAIVDVDLFP